ncbi:MAG: APC family permease [Bacteroidales bacterium]|nr:APC family permease [Bacteroidales bacterium]
MNEKAQNYINEQIAHERERYEQEKNSVLKQLGLGEIEYQPKGGKKEDYPEKDEEEKRYRFIPIEISDEDFEELKRHIPSSETIETDKPSGKNSWYKFSLAVTILAGFTMLLGLLANSDTTAIISGSVFGYMLFFMLPIISLLSQIEQNQRIK